MAELRPFSDRGCVLLLLAAAVVAGLLLYLLTPPAPPMKSGAGAQSPASGPGGAPSSGRRGKGGRPARERPEWPPKPAGELFQPAVRETEATFADFEWTTIYRDDFSREELGPDWTAQGGTWRLRDGALVCEEPLTNTCMAVCSGAAFSGNLEVEYDCRAEAGTQPVDLSFAICLPSKGEVMPTHGYFFGFGSWDNTQSGLATGAAHRGAAVHTGVRIQPGTTHHVHIQRYGKYFAMYVDGERVFAGIYRYPVPEEAKMRGAFYVARGRAVFDNLVVRRPARDIAARKRKEQRRTKRKRR